MKRALAIILILMLVLVLPCTAAEEEDDPNRISTGNGYLTVSGNIVESYTGPFIGPADPIVVIPDMANGWELTMIWDRAFQNTGVGVVVLPMNTVTIGKNAFSGMKQLTAINVGVALVDIGERAFANDYSLVEIGLDAPLTFIGDFAFYKCQSLINIKLPVTLDTIGDNAFEGCTSLSGDILIPGSCILGERVFWGCKSLKRVVIGDYMKEIPLQTFSGCASLNDLYLPDNLRTLHDRAFEDCKALETVYLPPRTTTIGASVFTGCSSLKELYMPASVTAIDGKWRGLHDAFTIHGVAGSYGEEYAEQYGFHFVADYNDYTRKADGTLVKTGGSSGSPVTDPEPAPVITSTGIDPAERGTAHAATQVVDIGGRQVELQAYALTDETGSTNYVKVRDVADALDGTAGQFDVRWDGSIDLVTGTAYASRNGQENQTPYSGDRDYVRSSAETKVNGKTVSLRAFLILDDEGNGSTYYKLRDLGQALGFNVGWEQGRGIYLEPGVAYDPSN